jgi:hypothetical protein
MRRVMIASLCSVILVFALKCQGGIPAVCTHGATNCEYEDNGFFCCVPEGESYQAVGTEFPTVVMVGGEPAANCAQLIRYNWITDQCDISTTLTCGGMAVSQDCDSNGLID